MSEDNPESNRFHPAIGELLLYKEGELDPVRAKSVEDHVALCDNCRHDLATLSQGMANFTAALRSVRLPDAPASPESWRSRLIDLAAAPRKRRSLVPDFIRSFRWLSASRIAFAGALVGVLLLGVLLFQTAQPSARASQFLERSIVASDSIGRSHKVFHQKVRLRQGNRVLEKGVFRGVKYEAGDAPPRDPAFEETLRLAAVDWNDPLNPRDFARWRDAQKGGSDRLSESAQTVTITTSTRDAAISAASLTIARSDWHPVARRIELKAQPPVEITEIASELIDADEVEAASTPPADAPAPEGLSSPSALQLEESELRLRETLASLGLDTTAAPEIRRSKDRLYFRAYPASPEEAEKLSAAIRDIPYVVTGKESSATASTAVPPPDGGVESSAPYAGTLEKSLGGLEQTNQYLATIQEEYQRALAHSAVVSRLADRYPAGYPLPDPLERRLEILVGGHVAQEKRQLLAYLQSLSERLELLGARDNQEPAPDGNCAQWQGQARLVATELHDLHVAFMRLFIADKSETAAGQTPESMLARSVQLKTSLTRNVAALCAPGQ